MIINTLTLKNYRNHADLSIKLDGKNTLIKGPNGSGKSNILEAIHMLSTTKSLKVAYDKDVIAYDKPHASILTEIQDNEVTSILELHIIKSIATENGSKKMVKVNKVKKTLQNFISNIYSVLFTPEDIDILTGSPSDRRRYMDLIFFQFDAKYKEYISNYSHALKQKNKILENLETFPLYESQIAFWNDKLIEFGTYIHKKRLNLITNINNSIKHYKDILGYENNTFNIVYEFNEITNENLEIYKQKERWAKKTLIGPHRDDFTFLLNDKNISYFGSRGQQRSAILAIKLCEVDYIFKNTNIKPILLLDDIYSELDDKHKQAINNIISNQQTIITTAYDSSNGIEISFI